MDENKLRGLMGLCVRAGQAVFGEDGCMKAIRQGQCAVLLMDGRASPATRDKYRWACFHAQTPLGELPEGLLHAATGKPGVAMAVQPGGLADQIQGILPVRVPDQPMTSANKCGGASVE